MAAPVDVLHVHAKLQKRTDELRDVLSCGQQFKAEDTGSSVRVAVADEDTPSRFDAANYFKHLQSQRVGATLLTASQLTSTQTIMSENFHVVPDGTVCVADVQTSGRGRGGNSWTSPEGCLMFSFITRMRDGRTLPLLQYVVTLAVVEAIQDVARNALASFPPLPADEGAAPTPPGLRARLLDVRIKWPNDIYANGLKIGGVLCNSVHSDGMFCVTIGVGLNVTNKEPTTCVAALLADAAAARDASRPVPVPGREELLARIASQYEELEARFVDDNSFDALRPAYLHHWLHSQQVVTLEEGVEGASRPVPVTIQGLTSSGYLLAVDEAGERYELHPDGNSLDWFAGLVRRKMKA